MTRIFPRPAFDIKARDVAFVRLRNAVVHMQRKRGLGDADSCAAIGLNYDARFGSCTNLDVPKPDAGFVQTPFTSAAGLPANLAMNPATGVIEEQSEIQRMANATRFGPQVTPDRETQLALAAEAERLGRARGVDVRCEIYAMGDPVFNKAGFSTDCRVNGDPGHNAALLVRSGGMETGVISASYNKGEPLYQVPALTPVGAVAAADASGRPSQQQWIAHVQPVETVEATPPAMTKSIPVTGPAIPNAAQPKGPSTQTPSSKAGGPFSSEAVTRQFLDVVEQVKSGAAGFGLPSWWPWAAAAAVGGYFAFGGKRR